MNQKIEAWTTAIASAVDVLKQHMRRFFYELVLSGKSCPTCTGSLEMIREGECRCRRCDRRFDPTTVFQRCEACGGTLWLNQARYHCEACDKPSDSRFRFDPVRFDSTYFRKAMAEHRRRIAHRRRLLVETLLNARSGHAILPAADLDASPGLIDALDSLTVRQSEDSLATCLNEERFNLARYEQHIMASVAGAPIEFDSIQPLCEPERRDRIRRFVAVIFLAHDGRIDIHQNDRIIELTAHETHRERRSIPLAA